MPAINTSECQRTREAYVTSANVHSEVQQHITGCHECRQFFQKLENCEQKMRQTGMEIDIPDKIADCLELRLKNNQNLFDQKLFNALKFEVPDDSTRHIIRNCQQPYFPLLTMAGILLFTCLYFFY